MTFLLTIIMLIEGHVIERPLGQMVDQLSCEAAGVAMVHMLIEGPVEIAATFRCEPIGALS